jgi:hypothetical protein
MQFFFVPKFVNRSMGENSPSLATLEITDIFVEQSSIKEYYHPPQKNLETIVSRACARAIYIFSFFFIQFSLTRAHPRVKCQNFAILLA